MSTGLSRSRTTTGAIHVAAAVVADESGRVLLVRKRGTTAFMQPGGKINGGEQPHIALSREVAEELGCRIASSTYRFLGRFSAPAANEPGYTVEAVLYAVALVGNVIPASEIEEIAWVDPIDPGSIPLAPLTRDHVLPLIARRAEARV